MSEITEFAPIILHEIYTDSKMCWLEALLSLSYYTNNIFPKLEDRGGGGPAMARKVKIIIIM